MSAARTNPDDLESLYTKIAALKAEYTSYVAEKYCLETQCTKLRFAAKNAAWVSQLTAEISTLQNSLRKLLQQKMRLEASKPASAAPNNNTMLLETEFFSAEKKLFDEINSLQATQKNTFIDLQEARELQLKFNQEINAFTNKPLERLAEIISHQNSLSAEILAIEKQIQAASEIKTVFTVRKRY